MIKMGLSYNKAGDSDHIKGYKCCLCKCNYSRQETVGYGNDLRCIFCDLEIEEQKKNTDVYGGS